MEKQELVRLLNAYRQQSSVRNKQDLIHAAALYIFLHLESLCPKTRWYASDHRNEFLLWMYGKIESIIDNFDAALSSFPTYLSVRTQFAYLHFLADRKKERAIRDAAEQEERNDRERWYLEANGAAESTGSQCAEEQPVQYGKAVKRATARGVLLLALKSAFSLSESMIDRTAAFCGIPREQVESLVAQVQRDYAGKQTQYEAMRTRRYQYYLRAFSYQTQLRSLQGCENADTGNPEKEEIRKLQKQQQYCERQKNRLQDAMRKLRRTPSNRYLASLLGIPQRTVDQTIVRLKKQQYDSSHGTLPGKR